MGVAAGRGWGYECGMRRWFLWGVLAAGLGLAGCGERSDAGAAAGGGGSCCDPAGASAEAPGSDELAGDEETAAADADAGVLPLSDIDIEVPALITD
jgi:hypothetical protein